MSNECCQKPPNKNKGLLFFLIAVVVILGSFFWIRGSVKSANQKVEEPDTVSKLVVGYCPTMKAYLHLLDGQTYDFLMLPSSAVVLEQLKLKEVDVALIGRKAAMNEIIQNTQEQLLIDGFTLVGQSETSIDVKQLSDYTIHTYLDTASMQELFVDGITIQKHQDLEKTLDQLSSDKDLALITWSQHNDNLHLVIPTNNEIKVLDFRSPHLYYSKEIANVIQLANNQDET